MQNYEDLRNKMLRCKSQNNSKFIPKSLKNKQIKRQMNNKQRFYHGFAKWTRSATQIKKFNEQDRCDNYRSPHMAGCTSQLTLSFALHSNHIRLTIVSHSRDIIKKIEWALVCERRQVNPMMNRIPKFQMLQQVIPLYVCIICGIHAQHITSTYCSNST